MNRTKRLLLAALGVLLVGIGALGVVLPGLPTTIFLLGASACFARSWPWLEQKLLQNRFFAPYMRILDGTEPMTRRARIITMCTIWVAVSISLWVLHAREALPVWLAIVLVVAAVVGNVFVWRWKR